MNFLMPGYSLKLFMLTFKQKKSSVPSFLARHCTMLRTGDVPSLGPNRYGPALFNVDICVVRSCNVEGEFAELPVPALVPADEEVFMDSCVGAERLWTFLVDDSLESDLTGTVESNRGELL